MRKLASIKRIDRVVPHKNADRLEVAIIGGWPAVVGLGQFQAGDLVVFCEVDSLLPPRDEYAFLEKSCRHLATDGVVWYRIKTARLRGQLSQGLVLPLETLDDIVNGGTNGGWIEGTDVTELLGVTKFEKPIAPQLAGTAKGPFPYFIQKTDEERVQNLDIADLRGRPFYRSEKLDGSSCTIFQHDGKVGVCSRNLELVENPDNTFWKVAQESGALDAVLQVGVPCAIQGEVIGPGIQGNRYKLSRHLFYAFNVYDIAEGRYLSKAGFHSFCNAHGIQTVPELSLAHVTTMEDVLAHADGFSEINPETRREGVVWVTVSGERISFKAISNEFLLREK